MPTIGYALCWQWWGSKWWKFSAVCFLNSTNVVSEADKFLKRGWHRLLFFKWWNMQFWLEKTPHVIHRSPVAWWLKSAISLVYARQYASCKCSKQTLCVCKQCVMALMSPIHARASEQGFVVFESLWHRRLCNVQVSFTTHSQGQRNRGGYGSDQES